jgi:hypothetical protein
MSNIINRDTIGDMARRAATKYGDKTAVVFRDLNKAFILRSTTGDQAPAGTSASFLRTASGTPESRN